MDDESMQRPSSRKDFRSDATSPEWMVETGQRVIIKSAWKLKLPPVRSLAVIRDPEMAYRRYAAVGFYYRGE